VGVGVARLDLDEDRRLAWKMSISKVLDDALAAVSTSRLAR
jgi:hypothetical protein